MKCGEEVIYFQKRQVNGRSIWLNYRNSQKIGIQSLDE